MKLLLTLVAVSLAAVIATEDGVFTIDLKHAWDGNPELGKSFIQRVYKMNEMKKQGRKPQNGNLQPSFLETEAVDLTNHQTFYTGEITVGTGENQKFDVIFDTGSSKLVIPSTYCGEIGCTNHHRFNPVLSRTYHSCTSEADRARGMYKAETTEYGSGSVTGVLGADVVKMASNCQINPLVFGQIMEEHGEIFYASAFDGVMGVGPPDARFADEEEDVSYVIHDQNILSHNIYSFYFGTSVSEKGRFTLGSKDTRTTGPEYSLNIMNPDPNNWAYWEVRMTDVKVNGQSINVCGSGKSCTAILDTGTTLVVGPGRVLGEVNHRASISHDCSNLSQLPTVTFQLDGHDFELTPQDYVLQSMGYCVSGFTNEDNPFEFDRMKSVLSPPHNASKSDEERILNTVLLEGEHKTNYKCDGLETWGSFVESDDETITVDEAKSSGSALKAGLKQNLAARTRANAQVDYSAKYEKMRHVLENSAKRTYSFERAKSTSSNARVILGITFLKKYISSFDYDNSKVFLSEASHGSSHHGFHW